jgi:hypothetical protein
VLLGNARATTLQLPHQINPARWALNSAVVPQVAALARAGMRNPRQIKVTVQGARRDVQALVLLPTFVGCASRDAFGPLCEQR